MRAATIGQPPGRCCGHEGAIAHRALQHERQRRFPTDQWGYELLGGLVEDGEDPAATAAREVEEESGWRPVGEGEHLLRFEPLPGQITAPTDVYLWRKAEHIGDPTETEEVGRIEWVPLGRIPELIKDQQVLGAGAVVPLLYYIAQRQGSGQPT